MREGPSGVAVEERTNDDHEDIMSRDSSHPCTCRQGTARSKFEVGTTKPGTTN